MKIVVLDGYGLNPGDLSWEYMKALGDLTVYDRTTPSEVLERSADAEVLITNKTVLSAKLINALPKVKYIGVSNVNLEQLKQIKKLGPLENLIKMIPGASKMGLNNVKVDPKDMAHIEAIILSMTPYERKHPEVLKASRKIRIAKGSGRSVEEVNRLLKQFDQMKQMMKQLKNGNFKMPF
mgnify:CR=1 FL=1